MVLRAYLSLHSRVTPVGAQGDIWVPGIKLGLTTCKANILPTLLSIWPQPRFSWSSSPVCTDKPSWQFGVRCEKEGKTGSEDEISEEIRS